MHKKNIFELIKKFNPNKISQKDFDSIRSKIGLKQWTFTPDKLHRRIEFSNFYESMAFMNAVAVVAQNSDHHPDWCNVYNRVDVNLNTHDIGGVSMKDVFLAKVVDVVETKVRQEKVKELDVKVIVEGDELVGLEKLFEGK